MKFLELFCHEANQSVIVNLNHVVNIYFGELGSKTQQKNKFYIKLDTTKDERQAYFRTVGDMMKMLDNIRKACGLCEGISSWKNPMPVRGF